MTKNIKPNKISEAGKSSSLLLILGVVFLVALGAAFIFLYPALTKKDQGGQEAQPEQKYRLFGEVTKVDTAAQTFTITQQGTEAEITVKVTQEAKISAVGTQ